MWAIRIMQEHIIEGVNKAQDLQRKNSKDDLIRKTLSMNPITTNCKPV